MKILVTGFRPFLGESLNPSLEVLRFLSEDVDKIILPVSYQGCVQEIEKILLAKDYDYILMLGQAGGRDKICLEKQAVNSVGAPYPDEDGQQLQDQVIDPQSRSVFFTALPISEWLSFLPADQVKISDSAGTFVCNFLYFKTLDWLFAHNKKTQAVFIHLPWIPEQKKQDQFSLPLIEMADVLNKIIDKLSM